MATTSVLDLFDDTTLYGIMCAVLPCADEGAHTAAKCLRHMNEALLSAYPRARRVLVDMTRRWCGDPLPFLQKICDLHISTAICLARAGLVDELVAHISSRDMDLSGLMALCATIGTVEVDLMDRLLKAIKPYELKWFTEHANDPDIAEINSSYDYAKFESFGSTRHDSWRSYASHMEFVSYGFVASPNAYAADLADYIIAHPQRMAILTSLASVACFETYRPEALITILAEKLLANTQFVADARSATVRQLAVYFAVFGPRFVSRIMNMQEDELIEWMRNGPFKREWCNITLCNFMATTKEMSVLIARYSPAVFAAMQQEWVMADNQSQ